MRQFFKRTISCVLTLLVTFSSVSTEAQIFKSSKSGSGGSNQEVDEYVGKLLNQNLPLALNADDAYPTVPDQDMLGGPFHGRLLPITLDNLNKPLAPGDYIVPITFFCSEYSVHQPGQGTAYTLGPVKGSAATAISTLLWRGMLTGKKPKDLQAISWAIQSSTPYDKMPAEYRKTIDQLIPDMKGQLNGQGFAKIESGWNDKINGGTNKVSNGLNRGLEAITGGRGHAKVQTNISLDAVFARLPPPFLNRLGRLALDGERISNTITDNTLDAEKREQKLFAGQGEQSPPIPAVNGPWSVKIPGVAYMRFVVKSGNLAADNFMQIRILPPRPTALLLQHNGAYLKLASYQATMAPTMPPTLLRLFGGEAGEAFAACSVGTVGAGDLGPCEALAIVVASVTAYAINAGKQAPVLAPGPPSMMAAAGGSNKNKTPLPITPPQTTSAPPPSGSGNNDQNNCNSNLDWKQESNYEGEKPEYENTGTHDPTRGGRGLVPGKTPLPGDAQKVFDNSIPDSAGKNWYGINDQGVIYRFAAVYGKAHFNGTDADDRGIPSLPVSIARALKKWLKNKKDCKQ